MRAWVLGALLMTAFAGCVDEEPGTAIPDFPLDVYRFQYEGSDVFVPGVAHGWLLRISNPSDAAVEAAVVVTGVTDGHIGPLGETGGAAPQTTWMPGNISQGQFGPKFRLEPGESSVILARITAYDTPDGASEAPVSMRVIAASADDPLALASSTTLTWTVAIGESGERVQPGHHVQTVTVGVWLNGTSFYSNAAGALQDPDFPHGPGWTTPDDDTTPLPIYVYNQNRTEQPEGSKDTCHFTTITGYNGLLRTQAEGSTNVALLRPEQAYTTPERSPGDHPLYGDFLIFMNTVVAIDGATGPEDVPPNPNGDCFERRLDGLPIG